MPELPDVETYRRYLDATALLRHPRFLGLRTDKPAREVEREVPT